MTEAKMKGWLVRDYKVTKKELHKSKIAEGIEDIKEIIADNVIDYIFEQVNDCDNIPIDKTVVDRKVKK